MKKITTESKKDLILRIVLLMGGMDVSEIARRARTDKEFRKEFRDILEELRIFHERRNK